MVPFFLSSTSYVACLAFMQPTVSPWLNVHTADLKLVHVGSSSDRKAHVCAAFDLCILENQRRGRSKIAENKTRLCVP